MGGATPAEAFADTITARPAPRPLPAPVFVTRHVVDPTSGRQAVPPYMVNIGRRWAGHTCDSIRDGHHIAISSGTTPIRELTADPTRQYQRLDPSARTYRTR